MARVQIEKLKAHSAAAAAHLTAAGAPEDNPRLSRRDLAFQIQGQLNRLGCDAGRPDGAWGRKSRKALSNFAKRARIQLASLDPKPEVLDALKAKTTRVCPKTCSPRHHLQGESCVLKSCPAGQSLTRTGTCKDTRKAKPKSKDRRKTKSATPTKAKRKGEKRAERKRGKSKPPRGQTEHAWKKGACPKGFRWRATWQNCVKN